ncbi:MAG: hypothetical protein HON43_00510 [Alphaproteobacteria bacterium]|nr:hypothetical protein [Alphaproteobacteria bacterium]MBT5390547.1 hypothetical protein [Alphaproteobacteria bacterium]
MANFYLLFFVRSIVDVFQNCHVVATLVYRNICWKLVIVNGFLEKKRAVIFIKAQQKCNYRIVSNG